MKREGVILRFPRLFRRVKEEICGLNDFEWGGRQNSSDYGFGGLGFTEKYLKFIYWAESLNI